MCCTRVEVFWMPLRMERMNSLARCFLFLASPRRHRQNQIRLDLGRWNGTMVDQREMISSQTPRLSIIFDHFDVIPFIQLWKWGRRSSDSRRLIQRPFHSHSQSLLPLTYGFHRSEEHTSELQSLRHLVCRLLLEKKKYSTKCAET